MPRQLWLTSILALAAACQVPADLVIVAPTIHTLDPAQPRAERIAVRAGRIVTVGPRTPLPDVATSASRTIELPAGACVIPGFVDAHAHLLSLGHSLRQLELGGATRFEELVARTAERAARLPKGSWIIGRGWDQNRWPGGRFPDHRALSAATPDHPVLLTRVDGHAILANARAMELAGVNAATSAPSGGEILRDANGHPTGVFVDAATSLVERIVPPPTAEEGDEALERALETCRRNGITTLHDAGVGRGDLELYRRAARAGRLTLRIYAMLDGSDAALIDEWFARGPSVGEADGMLAVRAVKLYADGALGSRGAALLDDYSDRPGHRGLSLQSTAALTELATRALAAGFQVCTHAIGDAANRSVLDAYAAALARHAEARPGQPRPDHRFRIEHAQIVSPADVPRFAALGVIASVQTCHAISDGPWVPARLGPERARRDAYVWRSLLDAGARLCNGTDAPVEPISPLRNFFAAITRQDERGELGTGFFPEQCMTRAEALASLTAGGATAGFADDRSGRIAVGRSADLTVLSVDPLRCAPRELLDARVLLTVVGGRVVFEGK